MLNVSILYGAGKHGPLTYTRSQISGINVVMVQVAEKH
jgi:hypothetical protein